MHPTGIVVAVVVALVILSVYFSPPVLGGPWQRAVTAWTGQTPEQLNAGFPRRVALWLVTAIVNAVVLAWLLSRVGITDVGDAMVFAGGLWMAIGATFSAWPVIFQNQPPTIWILNNVAYLLIQLVSAAILVTVR